MHFLYFSYHNIPLVTIITDGVDYVQDAPLIFEDDDSHGDPFENANRLSLATAETPDLLSVNQLLDSVSLFGVLLFHLLFK